MTPGFYSNDSSWTWLINAADEASETRLKQALQTGGIKLMSGCKHLSLVWSWWRNRVSHSALGRLNLKEIEKEQHVREKQDIRENKIHVCVFLWVRLSGGVPVAPSQPEKRQIPPRSQLDDTGGHPDDLIPPPGHVNTQPAQLTQVLWRKLTPLGFSPVANKTNKASAKAST